MLKNIKKSMALLLCLAISVSVGYANDEEKPKTATEKASVVEVGKDGKKTEANKITRSFKQLSQQSETCVTCHADEHPGIYQQWGDSKHYGANVGCYECHKADADDPDAIRHKDFMISVLVTPDDCGGCHEKETEEFADSYHATAGLILGSLDNVLAEVVEGYMGKMGVNGQSAPAVQGCWACHGSPVKVNPDGTLDAATWPNSGIGRLNPDGSKGTCAACHQRHEFSVAQVRQPETCGKCHLGPDHPQKEIYEESKHGISYYTNKDKMNLDSEKWIAGEDYDAAPTCATCHMSATKDLPVTHDIGARLSWTLRPPISVKIDETKVAKKRKEMGLHVKSAIEGRKDMKEVCRACHAENWIENWYEQFDGVVVTYNEKFAKPGAEIMKALVDKELRTKTAFDEEIEWTWFYLWHHEGRRLRHGAAMQGPDYVQWHGFFEVAERFYIELVPQARELAEEGRKHGKEAEAKELEALIDEILERPEHQWYLGKRPSDEAQKKKTAQAEFMKPYLEGTGF